MSGPDQARLTNRASMNQFRFSRRYVGPVKACILDWSGTTIDKYVLAPAVCFKQVFEKFKVPITTEEAREPMGLRKDVHIAEILRMQSVRKRWQEVYGRLPTDEDVTVMFESFKPMQMEVLRKYGGVLPGTVEATDTLRKDFGCKIGVTTGFFRPMAKVILEEAAKEGFVPDADVTGDEVKHGARPQPFMLYKNLDILGVHPIEAVVKVDDTVKGIGEAQSAGCWGVGVARYSNYMNIDSLEHEASLSEQEIEERVQICREKLLNSGAHYIIDTMHELPAVVADINARLARGERP